MREVEKIVVNPTSTFCGTKLPYFKWIGLFSHYGGGVQVPWGLMICARGTGPIMRYHSNGIPMTRRLPNLKIDPRTWKLG
jgi:hypothetical protein